MNKRLLCLLLVCALTSLISPALAGGSDYAFDPQTGTIIGYTGSAQSLVVPSEIDGVPVRALGVSAFGQNFTLREVSLPEGLTHLLASAFYFCESLERVNLPTTLQAIDGFAFFANKSLKEINLPASLVYVGEQAFASCETLAQVRFLGPVPLIDSSAFEFGPQDRQFTVPESAMEAYQSTLPGPFLTGEEQAPIKGQANLAFDAENGLVTGYSGMDASLVIPEALNGKPITGIAERAFYAEQWLRVVSLPDGLKTIGKDAFFSTKLARVHLGNTLTEIGEDAFSGAPLISLEFPDSLKTLGKGAFTGHRLKELHLPKGIKQVPEKAFQWGWQLETLYIPANIEQIDSQAFLDCDRLNYLVFDAAIAPQMAEDAFLEADAIVDIDIAHDATREQALAFEEAFKKTGTATAGFKVWRAYHPQAPAFVKNLAMTFDEGSQMVTSYSDSQEKLSMYFNYWKADGSATLAILGVGEGAFEGSTLKEFYVPRSDDFTTIGARAFKNSALTFIDLFDSVTDIGEEAFSGCKGLTAITLPRGLKHLGTNAFQGCENLAEVVLPAGVTLAGPLGISAEKIRVAAEASDEQVLAFRAALNLSWDEELLRQGETSRKVPLPLGLNFSPEAEFEFDPETGTIQRYIGQSPIVTIPRSIGGVPVTGIGFTAFSNLSLYTVAQGTQDNLGLEEVLIPDTVRRIEDSAFVNCAALRKVTIYGPIDLVGIRAFENCLGLEEIVFHNGLKEIGIYAFNLCQNLRHIDFGPSNPPIPEGAFVGCGFEGTLVVAAPTVGNLAYQNNAKVTAIHILESVEDLGEAVFAGISNLEEVYFEQADAKILGDYRYQFDQAATEMKVYIPESASDEQLKAFQVKMNQNMLPGDTIVSLKNCPENHDEPRESPEPQATVADGAETSAPPAPAQDDFVGKYRCVMASSGGVAIDLTVIGEYSVEFFPDQTAVLTISGNALPKMNYTVKEGNITLDYYGQAMIFKALPEGGYALDYLGAMLLTFQKE